MNRLLWLTVGLVCLILGLVRDQSVCEVVAPSQPAVLAADSADYDSSVVASITIDNRNIYDTKDPRYSSFLFRLANKLHYVTRKQVVRREVLLQVGKPYLAERAEETARNLRRILRVNAAWVEATPAGKDSVNVKVVTVDQWSLVGGVRSLSLNSGENHFRFGFEERNLWGRAQFVSFDYNVEQQDDNYVVARFREPRIFSRSLRIELAYSSNPRGRLKSVALGRPYYRLSQQLAFDFSHETGGGLREQFQDGLIAARWDNTYHRTSIDATYRWGPDFRKLGVDGGLKYVSQRTRDAVALDADIADQIQFPLDSIYYEPSAGLFYEFQKFVVLHRINGFDYAEDFTLGYFAALHYSRAYLSDFNGYLYNRLRFESSISQQLGNHLIQAGYNRSVWFKDGDDIRRLTSVYLRAYNTGWHFLTLAFRTMYVSDRIERSFPLVLGGDNGLRGYASEAMSGEKSHVVNLEGRFFPGLEILSVMIGGVSFFDVGRAWQRGEPMMIKDYRASYGIGLRFSLEKLTRGELIRVDLAHTEYDGWEILVGSGQYF